MKKILTIVGILVLVAALAIPMTAEMVASAEEAGTTEVSGNVTTQVTFHAPAGIGLGDMHIVWNSGHSDPGGYLSTNNPDGCTLVVYSDNETGTMVSPTWNALSYPLLVNTGNETASLGLIPSTSPQPPSEGTPPVDPSGVSVNTTPQTVMASSGPMGTHISLEVYQRIDAADPIDSGYSITLTYEATAN